MSERSSFVTEYIYCKECFEKLKPILCQSDKYLTGRQIDEVRVIAGKVGSLGPGLEWESIHQELKDIDLCCDIRFVIIGDNGQVYMFIRYKDSFIDWVNFDINKLTT
jgi:hypothetical protein